jgi:hypothetical protein
MLIPAFDSISIGLIKGGPAIEHIILKLALNTLPTGQEDLAAAVLEIGLKLALVLDPVVFEFVPVIIGKRLSQLFGLFIVQLAVPVELLVNPLAVVGRAVLAVVESALAVDFVVVEVAFEVGAVVV